MIRIGALLRLKKKEKEKGRKEKRTSVVAFIVEKNDRFFSWALWLVRWDNSEQNAA